MSAQSRAQAPQLSLDIPKIPQTHRIQLLSHDTSTQITNAGDDKAATSPIKPHHEGQTPDTLDSSNCPLIKLALCTEVLEALQDCFANLSSNFSTTTRRQLQLIVEDEAATFEDVSKRQPDLVMNSHLSLAHIRNTFERIKASYIAHDRIALVQLYQAICETEDRRQQRRDAKERPMPTARERYLDALKERDAERDVMELERRELRKVQQDILGSVRTLWGKDRFEV